MKKTKENFSNVAGLILGISTIGIPIVLAIWFWIGGVEQVAYTLLPYATVLASVALYCAVLFLALCIPKKTRGFSSSCVSLCGILAIPFLWILCAVYVYSRWSIIAILIGSFLGAGVYVLALLAIVLNGELSSIWGILFWLVFCYGLKYFGIYTHENNNLRIEKTNAEQLEKEMELANLKTRVEELERSRNDFSAQP